MIPSEALNALVAEKVLGWTHKAIPYSMAQPDLMVDRWSLPDGRPAPLLGIGLSNLPPLSTDHAAARLVEDAIERRGLELDYTQALARLVRPDDRHWAVRTSWALLRATPAERCRAALEAVRGAK